MSNKEQEYKELFITEALDNLEELNKQLTFLEKASDDQSSLDGFFRIIHTLKGNAAGMGYERIARFSHVVEDLISEIRNGSLTFNEELFAILFKSMDVLAELVDAINSPEKEVRFRGTQRRLEVILERMGEQNDKKTPQKPKTMSPAKVGSSKKVTKTEEKASDKVSEEETSPTEVAPTEVAPARAAPTEVAPARAVPAGSTSTQVDSASKGAEKSKDEAINLKEKDRSEDEENEKDPSDNSEHPKEDSDKKIVFSDLVQVPVKKLDDLLNLVGELTIERDRLMASHEEVKGQRNEYSRLNRISSDLQYAVMDVRLVQVGFLFNKFHRVVRDAAHHEQKEVDLVIEGSDTEIDRNILQIISDALIHLIRNSIGHGLEKPEERKKRGKDTKGKVFLSAKNGSEGVIIEIRDDGQGIDLNRVLQKAIHLGWVDKMQAQTLSDEEIISFIFQPGFSTRDAVDSISGRGVGMDVVKRALDSIAGNIKVESTPGQGSTFTLTLPSSMAVKGTLLFELSHTQYAIPLTYTEAVLSLPSSDIKKVQNRMVLSHLGKTMEVVFLSELFFKEKRNLETAQKKENLQVIIVQYNGKTMGFIVDKLLQQKEIVEKPLKKPVDFVKYISGVTILGNGQVCLVLNVPQIIQNLFQYTLKTQNAEVA